MIDQELLLKIKSSKVTNSREYIWLEYLKNAPESSTFVEFGVYKGRSINYMSAARPDCHFHGFDSFEGLPETWIKKFQKGHFKTDINTLKFNSNVKIYPGMFSDTIQNAVKLNTIYGVHVDCDLGSSTTLVLDALTKIIIDCKSYILFDELYNYGGYEEHEFKSLLEWSNKNNLDFEVLAHNTKSQQVLIKIK